MRGLFPLLAPVKTLVIHLLATGIYERQHRLSRCSRGVQLCWRKSVPLRTEMRDAEVPRIAAANIFKMLIVLGSIFLQKILPCKTFFFVGSIGIAYKEGHPHRLKTQKPAGEAPASKQRTREQNKLETSENTRWNPEL